jgi:hypothetical protein
LEKVDLIHILQEQDFSEGTIQEMNDNVDDCGRWVCFRIEMMRFGYTLSEFIECIQNAEKDTGFNV